MLFGKCFELPSLHLVTFCLELFFLFTDGHIDIFLQIRNLPLISPCHSNVLCCPYLFVKWSLSVIGSALSALCLEGMQKMKMFTLLQFLPLLSGAESAACKLSTAFLSKSRFTALSKLLLRVELCVVH